MKNTMKRSLSWMLSVLLALSCLAVLPAAVSAQATAPTIDGVLDEGIYTDAKKTVISTAYAGAEQGATDNSTQATISMWYTWDDTYNYVYVEISETGYAYTGENQDLIYFINNANDPVQAFIHTQEGGGYLMYTMAGGVGSASSTGSNLAPADYAGYIDGATGQTRRYELAFARGADATGFRVSPVVYCSGSHVVSYTSFFNTKGGKVVKYDDESTWAETVAPSEPEKPDTDDTIDGVKDDRYTDSKKITITTAFTGDHGAATENTSNMAINIWTAWDDSDNYIYAEISDPNGASTIEAFYVKNNLDPLQNGVYAFTLPGGGYVQNIPGGALTKGGVITQAVVVPDEGVRKFEFKFPRGENAEGFYINGVALAADHVVSSGKDINTTSLTAVKYADESTWVQIFPPKTEEPKPDEPKPDEPTPTEDGIDAIKDERYSEERMTLISKAYAGSGGNSIVNKYHIYSKTYYAWDDTNNYIFMEIHDPFLTQGLDILYYISNTNVGGGIFFNYAGGGYIMFNTSDGSLNAASDVDGRTLQYASFVGNGVRYYEIVMPKSEGAVGFEFSTVAYRDDGTFSVSYDSNYYTIPGKAVRYENQEGHWTDTKKVDPDVMTDPSKIEEIEAKLAVIPADIESLTLAEHEALVNDAKAAVNSVPDSWTVFIDGELLTRYKAAVTKILQLQAQEREAEIQAAEALIAALPDTVDLSDEEAVTTAKAAVDVLGDLTGFMDEELLKKLNTAVSRIEALHSPIKMDGKKDPAYDTDDAWPIAIGFLQNSSSDIATNNPDSTGIVYTMADEKYAYMYVEIFDANGMVVPDEDYEWTGGSINLFDCITTYIDLDPSIRPNGAPYQDLAEGEDSVFYFVMLADGTVPEMYINSKNAFLKDGTYLVPFTTENGYGFELKLPKNANEETFAFNIVFSDPVYHEDEEGTPVLSEEESMNIALGQMWAHSYTAWGEKFYEDYEVFANYLEVTQMIEALPDPQTITDHSCEADAQMARYALSMLNEDQLALIAQETIDALAAVEETLKTIPVMVGTYGDLNDDGKVDASDALIVLKIAVGKQTADETLTKLADVDGNKKVDASDALLILKKAVDKIEKFPVEE